ncbi:DUF4998 domain-containing protein [Mucilaginibacter angelicae]|uniref:DUF4998 domain-containing protein n=1 Tax=Mucilaginibacter angelicae TaxID=869718 RepID=A0ABV6KZS9_9SPHI
MKSYIKLIFVPVIFLLAAGCSKDATKYRSFLDKKELIYPGVISGLKAAPGNNRVLLTWSPSPDPSVNKYVVYWNDGNDSTVVKATSHTSTDTVKVYISNLGEYTYTFSLVSFDDKGNRSITSTAKATKVFGPLYSAGLTNRPYNSSTPSVFNGDAVTLNFNTPDTVNITTQIKYTATSGTEKKVFLGPKDNSITFSDYKIGQPILYQSSYLPVTGAVDTFYTSKFDKFPVTKDVTSYYLKNAINPIQPLETDIGDRFRSAKDWIVNDAIKNKTGSSSFGSKMGGWGADQGGSLLVTTEYPQPNVVNGKIYQTVRLPAGSYTLRIDLVAANYGSNPCLMVAAVGSTLPDLNGNIPAGSVLGYADFNSRELSFVLTEEKTVSIGFLMNIPAGNYWIMRGMTLVAKF